MASNLTRLFWAKSLILQSQQNLRWALYPPRCISRSWCPLWLSMILGSNFDSCLRRTQPPQLSILLSTAHSSCSARTSWWCSVRKGIPKLMFQQTSRGAMQSGESRCLMTIFVRSVERPSGLDNCSVLFRINFKNTLPFSWTRHGSHRHAL